MRPATRIGRWSARRPGRALGAWLLFVVAALALGAATGTKTLDNGAVGESARGYSIMDANQVGEPDREFALIKQGRATYAELAAAARDTAHHLSALGLGVRTLASPDRRAVLVVGELHDFVPLDRIGSAIAAVARSHPALSIQHSGSITANLARDNVNHRDLHRAELLSIPVTVLVLVFTFGALVAALVPVGLALTAVAAAFGLLGPLSQQFPIQDSAKTVVLLIGLAVGVDYSLFYIVRSREERSRGASLREALETTTSTSGRTVILSGTTVAIAVAGIYLVHTKVLSGIATGTIAVVACAVAGSVTVLPAVIALLGPGIDRGRIPFLPRLRVADGGRFWPAVVGGVLRRPGISLALSVGVLLALTVPALSLQLSKPGDLALAGTKEPALKTLAEARSRFPGAAETALVAVRGDRASASQTRRAIQDLQDQALGRGIAHRPTRVSVNRDRTAAVVALPLTGDGANTASRRAVEVLRRELVPRTAGVVTSAALVMVCVFALFATLSSLELKQTGIGLAVAVLLDATLIRAVALPASMKLLGDWNWYLPRLLSRLPERRAGAHGPG